MNTNIIDITKPVQTRNGRKVLGLTRIDAEGIVFPLVGVIEGDDIPKTWKNNGSFYRDDDSSGLDLVNVKEKKIVPLSGEDIKPSYVFKQKGGTTRFQTICYLGENSISIGGAGSMSFDNLRRNYLISRDGGTTWQNCEKEIEE